MKKLHSLLAITILSLISCNPKIDFSKLVPSEVDMFAQEFVLAIQKGDIDSCLSLVLPEMRNDTARVYLTNTHDAISNSILDSCRIISARKNTTFSDEKITNYFIDYEYPLRNKFLYLSLGVQEQNEQLFITTLNGTFKEKSLSSQNTFTLKNKEFVHYLFLGLSILIPLFIIITLVVAIRTKMKMKWLWIIGILFGFIKFSLNWTTGQIGFSLINISLLGSGIIKSGNVAPWILSFSIPVVAILFWLLKKRNVSKSVNTDISKEALMND